MIYLATMNRSSRQRCSVKKVFLKISKISQENTCVGVLFFKKVATLLKKDSNTSVFPVNIAKLLWTSILKNICERLLLDES